MLLLSGKRIHSHKWESLPFDDDMCDKVETMATEQKQPTLVHGCVVFGYTMTDSLSEEDINESESAEAEDVSDSNQNEAAIVEANMM